MTRSRANPIERSEHPNSPRRRALPGWAILLIVMCSVGGITVATHHFGIEADALAKVIFAVAGLVTALGLGAAGAGAAIHRRRHSQNRRNT